jgi:8-oxo-dGTP pyrophosphatase MutT (NUDIX family)
MLTQVQQRYATPICTNCGLSGHHFRNCVGPITSYGIIAFRIANPSWNQAQYLSRDDCTMNGLDDSSLEFLLIQRRDSIGFVELIRAKYKLTDLSYIKQQISGTTTEERNALRTKSFDELWDYLWGNSSTFTDNCQYKQEYQQAKVKFETLQSGVEIYGKTYSLYTILDTINETWDTPEWGFPKGRRNVFETDYQCAIREFEEETGITSSQYRVFENIDPIRETFFGNNKIHYCHVYYLAWIPSNIRINVLDNKASMSREIGDIGWYSIEASLNRIRSTNLEKREILLRTSSLLRMLCPMLVGPVAAVVTGQNEVEPFNRSSEDEQQQKSTGRRFGSGFEFGQRGRRSILNCGSELRIGTGVDFGQRRRRNISFSGSDSRRDNNRYEPDGGEADRPGDGPGDGPDRANEPGHIPDQSNESAYRPDGGPDRANGRDRGPGDGPDDGSNNSTESNTWTKVGKSTKYGYTPKTYKSFKPGAFNFVEDGS